QRGDLGITPIEGSLSEPAAVDPDGTGTVDIHTMIFEGREVDIETGEIVFKFRDLPGTFPKSEYRNHIGHPEFSVRPGNSQSPGMYEPTASGRIAIPKNTALIRLNHPGYSH
ncbi:MAG: hypothetical protein R6V85_05340, partial [Polyangia bacterium]